jgi:hypothetical protein
VGNACGCLELNRAAHACVCHESHSARGALRYTIPARASVSGDPLNQLKACALLLLFALSLSVSPAARAAAGSSQTSQQKKSQKQMKAYQKKQKKQFKKTQKAQKKAQQKLLKQHPNGR